MVNSEDSLICLTCEIMRNINLVYDSDPIHN